jgi:hypothetical protein
MLRLKRRCDSAVSDDCLWCFTSVASMTSRDFVDPPASQALPIVKSRKNWSMISTPDVPRNKADPSFEILGLSVAETTARGRDCRRNASISLTLDCRTISRFGTENDRGS